MSQNEQGMSIEPGELAERLRRVLTNDPALGVLRHADAGYTSAIECAKRADLRIPMLDVDP